MFCENCGVQNLESAKFCKHCGGGLFRVKKRKMIPYGIIVSLAIVFFGTSFFLLHKDETSSQPQGQANQSIWTFVTSEVLSGFSCGSQVKDADGNEYHTVFIGSQCWMASNINVGRKISGTKDQANNGKVEKWCYNDDDTGCNSDGGLYTWNEAMQYAVAEGARGICPTGWHIPSDTEQYALERYLKDSGEVCDADRISESGCASAGRKLQLGGSSGFDFMLTGGRTVAGRFDNRETYGVFWSSSSNGANAWNRLLDTSNVSMDRNSDLKTNGFSVRCMKNQDELPRASYKE
jgi:uncharacterized protein (TIGR02145 family)